MYGVLVSLMGGGGGGGFLHQEARRMEACVVLYGNGGSMHCGG